jgi:hypothetical protein
LRIQSVENRVGSAWWNQISCEALLFFSKPVRVILPRKNGVFRLSQSRKHLTYGIEQMAMRWRKVQARHITGLEINSIYRRLDRHQVCYALHRCIHNAGIAKMLNMGDTHFYVV